LLELRLLQLRAAGKGNLGRLPWRHGKAEARVPWQRGTAESSEPAPSRKDLRRRVRLGLQMASDGYFGLILCANRFELGAHTAFLFRPSGPLDISVGV